MEGQSAAMTGIIKMEKRRNRTPNGSKRTIFMIFLSTKHYLFEYKLTQ
jgi:hypothetical protein